MHHYGVTFGYYARNGYYVTQEARTEIDRIASLGIPWVCIVVIVLQETFASTRQFRDFEQTPADDEVRAIIDYAHSKGLKVQLRPMLECWDGTQRVHINFPREKLIIPHKPITHWDVWFKSLQQRTRHYAKLATRAGCEAFGIDSELDYTVDQQEHWLETVRVAREEYKGHVTSSHTWRVDFAAELRRLPNHWFHSLDSLGCSFYFSLADKPGASVEEMEVKIQKPLEACREVASLLGKPFYFGEVGCCSTYGAAREPGSWKNDGGYDGDEQARYLQAVLNTFSREPWWGGLYWWKWEEQNDRPWFRDDPRGEKGFSIFNKPAAGVFANFVRTAAV